MLQIVFSWAAAGVASQCSLSAEKSSSPDCHCWRSQSAVELPVVEQLALGGKADGGPAPLDLALGGLALELGVVEPLRAIDPAPQQRDRVELPVDLGELALHGLVRRELAGGHPHVGLEREPDRRVGRGFVQETQPLPVAHLDRPAPGALDVVGDREAVTLGPLGIDHVGQGFEHHAGVDAAACRDHVGQGRLRPGHVPQEPDAAALAADAETPAQHQAERLGLARGELHEGRRVGDQAEVGAPVAVRDRVDAGAAVGHGHPPAADLLDGQVVRQRGGNPGGGGRQRHHHQAGRELGILLGDPLDHAARSRIRTSTGARSRNDRASSSVPMCSPQCIGTATRGWIRRAASAASSAVIT